MRAADVPVLALEEPGSGARRIIAKEIERALAEDGAEAIVLGCAGMTDLARDLEQEAGVPVLDGVACAVALAESLVRHRAQDIQAQHLRPAPRQALRRRIRPLLAGVRARGAAIPKPAAPSAPRAEVSADCNCRRAPAMPDERMGWLRVPATP